MGLPSASVGQGVPAVDRAALVADSQSGSWGPKKKMALLVFPLLSNLCLSALVLALTRQYLSSLGPWNAMLLATLGSSDATYL